MRTYRVVGACIAVCLLVSSAYGVDTKGKFGMGIRLWGTPIITFSNMKIGIANAVDFEPSLGYYKWSDENNGYESSNSMLILSLIANYKPFRAERSNLLIKLGGLFGETSASYSTPYGQSSSSSSNLAILTGIGIEHMVNDNFSVNVGTLSGFWTASPNDSDSRVSFTTFGNQLVDFSLVWYLK